MAASINERSNQVQNVLIIEDDPFSSDMMMMLLARDFRTKVVGELSSSLETSNFESYEKFKKYQCSQNFTLPIEEVLFTVDHNGNKAKDKNENNITGEEKESYINVIIMDTEMPRDENLHIHLAEKISLWKYPEGVNPPKILFSCTHPKISILQRLVELSSFAGYVNKREILYSLASAACLVGNGYGVITPDIRAMLEKSDMTLDFPKNMLVVSSEKPQDLGKSTHQEGKMIYRLGLLFGLSEKEISDELNLKINTISKRMSIAYQRLGIDSLVEWELFGDFLEDDYYGKKESLDDFFDNEFIDNSKIKTIFQEVFKELKNKGGRIVNNEVNGHFKFKHAVTLAFHLLTQPKITKWNYLSGKKVLSEKESV